MTVSLGQRPISAMFFNSCKQALLLGTNQLAIYQHQDEEIETQQLTSHTKPVTVVLYNDLFNQLVSAGMFFLFLVILSSCMFNHNL